MDIDGSMAIKYWIGEIVGAMVGAFLVWIAYYLHWSGTEDPGLKLAVFSTGPAIRNYAWNLITEIIGTFVLVFGVLRDQRSVERDHIGPDAAADWPAGVRHRTVARWPDRLRDQPGA